MARVVVPVFYGFSAMAMQITPATNAAAARASRIVERMLVMRLAPVVEQRRSHKPRGWRAA